MKVETSGNLNFDSVIIYPRMSFNDLDAVIITLSILQQENRLVIATDSTVIQWSSNSATLYVCKIFDLPSVA